MKNSVPLRAVIIANAYPFALFIVGFVHAGLFGPHAGIGIILLCGSFSWVVCVLAFYRIANYPLGRRKLATIFGYLCLYAGWTYLADMIIQSRVSGAVGIKFDGAVYWDAYLFPLSLFWAR